MNVLSVYQTYAYFGRGDETSKIMTIARGLEDLGHQVTVLTADYRSRTMQRKVSDGPVDLMYLGTTMKFRQLTVNPGIFPFVWTNLRAFDIVHVYGLYDLLGPVVSAFCRRWGIPYVLEPMGMYRPKSRGFGRKRVWHRVVGHSHVLGAASLIANSESERQEIVSGGVASDRVVLHRNGVQVPPQLPPSGYFREKIGLPDDTRMILFIGRLTPIKSLDMLIDAFAWYLRDHDDRKTVLVLGGEDEGDGYRVHLERLASGSGARGQVLFPGPLYDADKWAAYRDADVFVLPSEYESFGNVVAEAMVAGTPVIATENCGIAPLVTPGLGRIVPHDVRSLRDALARLLEQPQGRHQRQASIDTISQLSWTEPLGQLDRLYHQVVAQ